MSLLGYWIPLSLPQAYGFTWMPGIWSAGVDPAGAAGLLHYIDPTRGCDDPGLFYGRLFRMIDFSLDPDEIST